MEFREVIRRRIRIRREGVDIAADLSVAASANVGERGGVTRASSHTRATATPSDPETTGTRHRPSETVEGGE
jgi:hypothetical protein